MQCQHPCKTTNNLNTPQIVSARTSHLSSVGHLAEMQQCTQRYEGVSSWQPWMPLVHLPILFQLSLLEALANF